MAARKNATTQVAATEPTSITTFKGFDKDLSCRGFKYEVGKAFEMTGPIRACARGFHACENPFDVWSYYGVGEQNRFAVVEQSGDLTRHESDSKVASAKITVTAELTLPEFISRAIEWIVDRTTRAISGNSTDLVDSGKDGAQIGSSGYGAQIGSSGYGAQIGSSGNDARIGSSGYGARIGSSGYGAQIGSSGNGAQIGSSGNDAQIGSSGYGAQIGSSGYGAQIGSSGNGARIGSSGNGAQIGSSGNGAQIGSSGYGARIGSSGYGAQIGSSGYGAQIGSSGYGAQIGSSGYDAQIEASGERAVIASAGRRARAKGTGGCWIALAEFDDEGLCIGFATGCAGRDGVPAETWLIARAGKLVAED